MHRSQHSLFDTNGEREIMFPWTWSVWFRITPHEAGVGGEGGGGAEELNPAGKRWVNTSIWWSVYPVKIHSYVGGAAAWLPHPIVSEV